MMSAADMRAFLTGGPQAMIASVNRGYADTSYVPAAVPPPIVPVTVAATTSPTVDFVVTFAYTPSPPIGARIAFGDGVDALALSAGNSHTYADITPHTATLRDASSNVLGTVAVVPTNVALAADTEAAP